ncbi:MAG TPA: hypothetical protein QF901_06230 [Gammaproteobacteria bacterium]|jgi:hypothetical protein|nr:hypothetical protein [Gammaproteobacteria bacterium]
MRDVKRERRQFLKGAAFFGGGAAVSVLAEAADVDEQTTETLSAPNDKGYRVTRHIRDYYRKARF